MSALALPRPDNLRGRFGTLVESDVYDICNRIKEVSPALYICQLDEPVHLGDKTYNFSIVEECEDGVDRLVYRVEELDARIIERLQYMLKIPFEKRLAAAEKLEEKAEEERKENDLMELYERMGRPMLTQLEHDGFTQRNRSYPKRGIKR